MAATRLIHSDDFSTYTSEADIIAAYPGGAGDGFDEQSTDWSLTGGPDGQPGIFDQPVGAARDTGSLTRYDLTTECYAFRVRGRWDYAATNAILPTHGFLEVGWEVDGDADYLVNLSRWHATDTLRVSIHTAAPYGNINPDFYFEEIPGVLTEGAKTVDLVGRRSTLTQVSPGVYEAAADGEIHVLIDTVEVFTFTGVVWLGPDRNPSPYWNMVAIDTMGRFSDWEIYDEPDCSLVPDADTDTCCASLDGEASQGGGQGNGATPWLQPVIGQQTLCAGGGLVPTQADLVPSELWWGL